MTSTKSGGALEVEAAEVGPAGRFASLPSIYIVLQHNFASWITLLLRDISQLIERLHEVLDT